MESLPFREKTPQKASTPAVMRLRKASIRSQIGLLLTMATSSLLAMGCKSTPHTEPILDAQPQAQASIETKPIVHPKPQQGSRQHAILNRIEILPSDQQAFRFNEPIVLSPYSHNYSMSISYDGADIHFDDQPQIHYRATDYARLDRVRDIEGDVKLALFHHLRTKEWPPVTQPRRGPELIRNGRIALGDWLADHTRNGIIQIMASPDFQALTPRLVFSEHFARLREEEDGHDLDLTFSLNQDPREKPIPLAMLGDNVNQLVALAFLSMDPKDPRLKALVDFLGISAHHVVGRIIAHLMHETGHSFEEVIDPRFNGYREINGIPLPAVFPRIEFTNEGGELQNLHHDDHWRDRFLASIAAGPNQLTLGNRLIYLRELRSNNPMNAYDGWSWIVQNSIMPGSAPLGYMLSDKIRRGKQGNNPGDINQYRDLLEEKGIRLDEDQMIQNNALALAANAETYRALIAITNHILGIINNLTGLGIGPIPDLPRGVSIAGADINWPLIQHFLTPNGEMLHTMLPINQQRQNPIMLEFSCDLDGTQKGARVDLLRTGIMLGHRTDWFTLEGGGSVATHRSDPQSLRALTGRGRLSIPILDSGATVTLQLTHLHTLGEEDPLSLIEGTSEGTTFEVQFNFRW